MAEPLKVYADDYKSPLETSEPIKVYADEYTSNPIVPQEDGSLIDLSPVLKQYGDSLTKKDILANDDLMDIVYSSLEARYTPKGILTGVRRAASGLAGADIGGGIRSQDYRSMDKEEAFETWQNYQRSFAGGQTVTTANELAYGVSADESIKARLGAGYTLFDQMDNAFTGEGSWREMADAMYDYTKSAVYDPSTILSLGLGKLFGFAGTKASSLAGKTLLKKAYQDQVKKGVAKQTALANVRSAAVKALPAATADAMIGAGVDVLYQSQLIKTNAQEEYSGAQTSLAALGSMFVIPTLAATGASFKELRKGPFKNTFLRYKELDEKILEVGIDAAEKDLRENVGRDIDISVLDETFGLVEGTTKDFLVWEKLVDKSQDALKSTDQEYTDAKATNAFFSYLFRGDPETNTPGYAPILNKAGFTSHAALEQKYGNRSAVLAQTLSFIPDDKMSQFINKFEKDTGYKLNFIGEGGNVVRGNKATSADLVAHFANQSRLAGQSLRLIRTVGDAVGLGMSPKETLESIKGGGSSKDPKRMQFSLSVYKRMLTSHLSTTGANLKGFAQLVGINTAADMFTASIELSQGKFFKLLGNEEAATKYFNKAYGSSLGAVRRGLDIVSPDIPMEYADKILNLNPKIAEKLFRDVAGDGGVRDAFADFNLDKTSKGEAIAWKTADAVTKGAQTIALVRMQDDLTKRWSFGTNLNQQIMKAYGMTPEEFFSRNKENWTAIEMSKPKFQEILEIAAYRTMRETASVNWSTLPGNSALRASARQLETITNRTPVGFVVPFGSFFNTTIATLGDLSGVNGMVHAYRRATGKNLDYTTPSGAEDLGKVATGISLITLGVVANGGARDRIENGLAHNQDLQSDGSIQDRQYDWPASQIRLMSQIVAHGLDGSNNPLDYDRSKVPEGLFRELKLQLGGQIVRDLDDVGKTLRTMGEDLSDAETIPEYIVAAAVPILSRPIQGITRPLDPINQVWGMVSDSNMNPDLRQGSAKVNEMLKYINNITGTSNKLPERARPTRGTDRKIDIGKQIFGTREISNPNLIEKMMNVAGQQYWEAIRFSGPPEIKNQMDAIAAPYFEVAALKALRKLQAKKMDYFDLPLEEKTEVLERIKSEVRTKVTSVVEEGLPSQVNLVRVLSGKDKDKVKNIMDTLGIEGDLEDLLQTEDGLLQLNRIKILLKNYDEIFFSDLE